jgi:hypothetical protein
MIVSLRSVFLKLKRLSLLTSFYRGAGENRPINPVSNRLFLAKKPFSPYIQVEPQRSFEEKMMRTSLRIYDLCLNDFSMTFPDRDGYGVIPAKACAVTLFYKTCFGDKVDLCHKKP